MLALAFFTPDFGDEEPTKTEQYIPLKEQMAQIALSDRPTVRLKMRPVKK